MQLLYYLLLFALAASAVIAILLATGILQISIHDLSNPDDLPDEIREMLDEEEKKNEQENSKME